LAAVVARQRLVLGDWTDEALSGPCYEHALIKRSRLLDRGLLASALLLAVALAPDAKAHLVLIVVTDKGGYVLDNLHQTVVRWDELPYRWVIRSSRQKPQYW
jgi:predicted transglutaminase-like cysteine proteinase